MMAWGGVLERPPSFAETIGRSIGRGFEGGVGRGLDVLGKSMLQRQKSKSLAEMLGMSSTEEGANKGFQAFSPQQEAMLALENPQAFQAYNVLKQDYEKKNEAKKSNEGIQSTLNELTDTLKEGNLGFTPKKYLTSKGRRDKQYFNTLSLKLEGIARELATKGALSKDRFQYLLDNIPSSAKSDAANAGAIEAWAKELGLEAPEELQEFYNGASSPKDAITGKMKRKPTGPGRNHVWIKAKNGETYKVPKEDIEAAKQHGGVVVQ